MYCPPTSTPFDEVEYCLTCGSPSNEWENYNPDTCVHAHGITCSPACAGAYNNKEKSMLKVGDVVQVTIRGCCSGWPIGTEGTISYVENDHMPYKVKSAGHSSPMWHCNNCLTLVSTSEIEMVQITLEEYDDLIEASTELSYLNMAGLDNWEGCSHAREMREADEK